MPYAQIVAKKLDHKKYKGAVIELAPRPEDILWENMAKSPGALRTNAIVGGLLVALVMVLYTVPLYVEPESANTACS